MRAGFMNRGLSIDFRVSDLESFRVGTRNFELRTRNYSVPATGEAHFSVTLP
jgi:hypothetical protein